MIDPLESLIKLQGDMPEWLEKAETLRNTAYLRYNEFAQLSEAVPQPPSLKRKQASTESLRPRHNEESRFSDHRNSNPDLTPPPDSAAKVQSTTTSNAQGPGKINIDPRNRHLFREIREQRRKRNSLPVSKGQAGLSKPRSRLSMVIFYDSSIQEGFELLVRNISAARSILRKSRTANSLRPRYASLAHEESPFGRQGPYAYRVPTIPRLGTPSGDIWSGGKTGLEVYDQLDRELEAAQTLCEVGAHQVLRDGDCFDELDDVKKHFETCTKLVDAEVIVLRDRDEGAGASRGGADAENDSASAKRQSQHEMPDHYPNDPSVIAVDGPIEVDDDDAASIIVDLSALPGRRDYSSKYGAKSRGTSPNIPITQPEKESSPAINQLPAPVVAVEDKAGYFTAAGLDVPLEAANVMAAASGVTVGDIAAEESEIDLNFLRQSIPRRCQPTPETEKSADYSDSALAAMRSSALKRRAAGPPLGRDSYREKPNPAAEMVDVKDVVIDSSFTPTHELSDEKQIFVVDSTHGMPKAATTQVV